MEVISLNESIDSESFVDWVRVTLGSDHEGDLAGLEVKIHRSVGNHCGIGGVGGIIGVALSFDVAIEVALGHSVCCHIRHRQVRSDFDHQLTKCEHVSLRKVIPEAQCELKGASLTNWQLDGLDHWMQLHLPDVPGGGVDGNCLSVLFNQASILSISREGQTVCGRNQRRSQ